MKQILILSFSKLQHDARVKREIEFLKKEYTITAAAFEGLSDEDVEWIKLDRPRLSFPRKAILGVLLLLRVYKLAHRILHGHPELVTQLATRKFDLIIANDIESLPLAFSIDPRARVLFDAHEYAPRHFEDKFSWRLFFQPFNIYLCHKFIPRVAAMTTVGTGLANEYYKHFNVRPTVITNAAWHHTIPPSPIDQGKIRMIHHGGSTVSRKLELMIEMMQLLDERFTLDLMLIVPEFASTKTQSYIDSLKSLAKDDSRIRFLPALKSHEIVPFINHYDVGVFLLPPVNFNYANTLPNKLFDFIQARLAVAIGPTPEMAAIVKEYSIGVVSTDFTPQTLAAQLTKLTTENVAAFKLNTEKPANDLSAEKNKETLLKLIADILST